MCSKLTIEPLEVVKYVQSQQWRHQNNISDVVPLLLPLNIFHAFFCIVIVDFEQVDVCLVSEQV